LMLAVRDNWSADVVEALLDAGADATLRDAQGRRAIDFAPGNQALAQRPATIERLEAVSRP
jgi:ankyrin repeat protein